MDLEGVMLHEKNQRKKNAVRFHSYGILKQQTNKIHIQITDWWLPGVGGRVGAQAKLVKGIKRYKLSDIKLSKSWSCYVQHDYYNQYIANLKVAKKVFGGSGGG